MHHTMDFILALSSALLDDPVAKLSQDALKRLRDPPTHIVPIEEPGTRFSILTYLALENSSQAAYNHVCSAARKELSNSRGINTLLSFHNVEKIIASYTGVVSIKHDMCCNSCITYTGPFSHLETCLTCGTSRWQEQKLQGTHGWCKTLAQTFTTIPIGPQLQALYRNNNSAGDMDYL